MLWSLKYDSEIIVYCIHDYSLMIVFCLLSSSVTFLLRKKTEELFFGFGLFVIESQSNSYDWACSNYFFSDFVFFSRSFPSASSLPPSIRMMSAGIPRMIALVGSHCVVIFMMTATSIVTLSPAAIRLVAIPRLIRIAPIDSKKAARKPKIICPPVIPNISIVLPSHSRLSAHASILLTPYVIAK